MGKGALTFEMIFRQLKEPQTTCCHFCTDFLEKLFKPVTFKRNFHQTIFQSKTKKEVPFPKDSSSQRKITQPTTTAEEQAKTRVSTSERNAKLHHTLRRLAMY